MKGLLLSIVALAACFGFAVILLRKFRPPRPARLLGLSYLISATIYLILYATTPRTLGFLPATWTSQSPIPDIIMGFIMLLLNFHNFLDFFFAVNGGFSTCLLAVIHQNRKTGITIPELAAQFKSRLNGDTISAWRLPQLVKTGYLTHNPQTDQYCLTSKGRHVATWVRLCKRLLNIQTRP